MLVTSNALALAIGGNSALIYFLIVGWIYSNALNKRYTAFMDNTWWTYGTLEVYAKSLSGYMSERTFQNSVQYLVKNEYLVVKHKGRNKVLWFAVGSKIPNVPLEELPFKGKYIPICQCNAKIAEHDSSCNAKIAEHSSCNAKIAEHDSSCNAKIAEHSADHPRGDAALKPPKQSTLLNIKNNNKHLKVVENDNQLINENPVEEKNEKPVVVDSFNNNCIGSNVTTTPDTDITPKADNSTTAPTHNLKEVAGFSTLGSIIGSMQAPNKDANGSLFKSKKVILPGDIQFQNPTNPEIEPLLYLADSVNVERPTVLKFVKNFGFEATLKQLCHLHNVMLKKTVKVPGAWLCTALKNNFDDNTAREKQKEQEKKTRIAREKKEATEKAALARAEAQAAFEETHKSDTPVTYGAPGADGFLYEISLRRMKRESPGKWDAWPTNFTAMLNLVLDPKKREPLFAPIDENYRELAIKRALTVLKPYEAVLP